MAAWWNPTYLPPCTENLTQIVGRYYIGFLFEILSLYQRGFVANILEGILDIFLLNHTRFSTFIGPIEHFFWTLVLVS
jgi:hypothetical protein